MLTRSLLQFLKIVYLAPEGVKFRGHTTNVVGHFPVFSFPRSFIRLQRGVRDLRDKRQHVFNQWVLPILYGEFIAALVQRDPVRNQRSCIMSNRRFNKRQRFIQQIAFRLPRSHCNSSGPNVWVVIIAEKQQTPTVLLTYRLKGPTRCDGYTTTALTLTYDPGASSMTGNFPPPGSRAITFSSSNRAIHSSQTGHQDP
jgi:hypothetical protein